MTGCAVEIGLAQKLRDDASQDADDELLSEIHGELIAKRVNRYSRDEAKAVEDFCEEVLLFIDSDEMNSQVRRDVVARFKNALKLAALAEVAHPNEKPAALQKAGEALSSVVHGVALMATEDLAEKKLQVRLSELEEEASYAAYERSLERFA